MENNKKYWLGLSLVPGLGPVTLSKALQLEPDPKKIWLAAEKKLQHLLGKAKLKESLCETRENLDLETRLAELEEKNIKIITREDEKFPAALREIYDPPPVLFVKGEIFANFPAVAIVGSRKSTRYGEKVSFRLAEELARYNITVISGMAEGIDRQAHLGALAGKSRTIAVLGSGHNYCYPYKNRDIFDRIPGQGAVISEFWLDKKPTAGSFPRRNRIISGMSQGVIVVEAARESGALITANLALEQNREIFAVPGNIDRPNSEGCNNLLVEGAIPVTDAGDIISHLFHEVTVENEDKKVVIPPDFTPLEKKIIKIFNRERELTLEELISLTDREAGELNSLLLKLEVREIITRRSGQKYYFEGLQNLLKPI